MTPTTDETMATGSAPSGDAMAALQRVIDSFQALVDDAQQAGRSRRSKLCLEVARELYGPVRDVAEEIRLTHGEVPSVRAGIARLDQELMERKH